MTGDQAPPRPAPAAGSMQAMFDGHYAGVLAGAAGKRVGGTGWNGGFRVDPEGYRVVIAKLEAALDELEAQLASLEAAEQRNVEGLTCPGHVPSGPRECSSPSRSG